MENRLKYKQNGSLSKVDINEDFFSQVSFTGERRLLPVGEINHVVDVGEEFNKERNKSSIYRLQGTVCPLFSNPLMNTTTVPNITGPPYNVNNISPIGMGLDAFILEHFTKDQTSSTVRGNGAFTNPTGALDLNYKESINQYLEEKDGWFGFTDPNIAKQERCDYYDIEPTRNRFDLNSNKAKNWELTITYPFASDSGHTTVYDTGTMINGLLIVDVKAVIVGGIPMTAFGTSTQHGLYNGNKVILTGMSNATTQDGTFTVKRLGLDNGDYQANYFTINVPPPSVPGPSAVSSTGRMRKVVNGEISRYYLRKFKKILVNDDYEMYPLAFSKTIYTDTNYQFSINEDIDVEGLKDNLGRPLSELYATFIKTGSGVFGQVKSGLDLELIEGNLADGNISNVRRIHDGTSATPFTSHTPLESNIYGTYNNPSKDWFYGDVVEYNRFTLREVKLADVLHRFNTTNRETGNVSGVAKGPRREGYLYNPHHLFKIREFSLYIEQGDETTGGIPDYAEYLGVNDGRYLWRDFLDIGVFDGEGDLLDYPFTNGAHYLHQNICFMTKRQDPFGNYDLYYEGDILNSDIGSGFSVGTVTIGAGGIITAIGISGGGSNYNENATVKITGGGGIGATATATSTGGIITAIAIVNGGSGYSSTPTVSIASFDPADPRGDALTDKFIIKKAQDVC